jgi:hypothetical protein
MELNVPTVGIGFGGEYQCHALQVRCALSCTPSASDAAENSIRPDNGKHDFREGIFLAADDYFECSTVRRRS